MEPLNIDDGLSLSGLDIHAIGKYKYKQRRSQTHFYKLQLEMLYLNNFILFYLFRCNTSYERALNASLHQ